MLFIHPMWDNESQRIGMQKCMPLGYTVHSLGELIGLMGLLVLFGTIGYMIYLIACADFHGSTWWLLSIPFGLGVLSEIMVQLSWYMVSKHGFKYDFEKKEASWMKDGKRVYYKYTQPPTEG